MLIQTFKSNQKFISVLVIFVAVLMWIPSFWVEQSLLINEDALFFNLTNNVLVFLLSSILIGIQGVYLNYIINEYKLLSARTFLPALFYVVFNAAMMSSMAFTVIIIVNTLLLIVLHQLFLIYNKGLAFSLSFNVGFIVAIAALLYPPIIIIFPLLWFVLFYTKTPNWRELVISILGLLVPISFYVSYFYLTGQLILLDNFGMESYQIFDGGLMSNNWMENLFFYLLIVITGFTGFHFIKTITNHVVRVKKYFLILTVFIFLLLSTRFLNDFDNIATYLLMTIPLSIFVADYFNNIKRKWLAELIFGGLLAAIIVGHFS